MASVTPILFNFQVRNITMKITIAKTAGFCMGVRRAVDMVLDAANRSCGPICTYGPLIHNPQVLQMLEEKGIPTMNHIPEKGEGIVLIRAHGVPPHEQKALEDAGFKVINATCPRVIRVQTIIRKHAEKGFAAVIIGDRDHPEVKGLMGYAQGRGYTVSTTEELDALPTFDNAIVVAQTTQDTAFYHAVKQLISEHHPHYKIFDTICDSTEKRQAETRRIARQSDVVVVVGGKESGNTRRLAQVAAETVRKRQDGSNFAIHIEDLSELDMSTLTSARSIAITAGASTPNWTIIQTCRAIESALQSGHNSPGALMLRVRNFLLRSNFLLSAGAGSLTYACSKLQGIDQNLIHAFIAMLYVLSMQILNNLFSIKSDRYNNPERAEFYHSNRTALAVTAIASGAAGLCLSFTTGILPFVMLCCMSLLGLLYNQKIFPEFLPPLYLSGRHITRIKDLPGSKTILIAAAWGTVTSLLPALAEPCKDAVLKATYAGGVSSTTTMLPAVWGERFSSDGALFQASGSISFVAPFIFATAILFSRTAFFAILEIQGDRITGKETIPIILGEKKSLKLIRNILLIASGTLFLSTLSGFISTFGVLIAIIPLLMLFTIKLHEKGEIDPGMGLEFIIESHFLLAGVVAAFF